MQREAQSEFGRAGEAPSVLAVGEEREGCAT